MKTEILVVIEDDGGKPEDYVHPMMENIFSAIAKEKEEYTFMYDGYPDASNNKKDTLELVKSAEIVVIDEASSKFKVFRGFNYAVKFGKPVIIIGLDPNVSSPDNMDLSYIIYDKDKVNNNDGDAVKKLKEELTQQIEKIKSDKANLSKLSRDCVVIENMIKNMMENIGVINLEQRENVFNIKCIKGKKQIFIEMGRVINGAKNGDILTTRLSEAIAVKDPEAHNFFVIINNKMGKPDPPDHFYRAITINNRKKYDEIDLLVRNNKGNKFTIYLLDRNPSYDFELAIAGKTVFVNFDKDEEGFPKVSLVFSGDNYVKSFTSFYMSRFKETAIHTIPCETLTDNEAFFGELKGIEKKFDEVLGKN
jgi:hypothetical protein